MSEDTKPSPVEVIKEYSDYLRGSIVEGLNDDVTGAVADDDTQLTKFHGIYQQDDRDLRSERKHQKLEPHFQFMVRLRLPGGVLNGDQWLALDRIAQEYANGTLRLTTRQTFQYHGVLKRNLKKLMQAVNEIGIDTKGACGDVNRNVVCNVNPDESTIHAAVQDWAERISEHLTWKSSAYEEIWLDRKPEGEDTEPLYGKTYLPRKFKIAIAIPPENDADVFANDIGLIAIVEDGELTGFNVAVGGGMGMTHGEPETYPRLGTVIGYCEAGKTLEVVEQLVKIQRDYGDRSNRKHARFKYTIDDRGTDWLKADLAERLGYELEEPRDYAFERNGDRYGWVKGDNGKWHLTLFIENGRIADFGDYPMMSGMRALAEAHDDDIRITCNQNIVIANVSPQKKKSIDKIVTEYGLDTGERNSALRRASMSCVAFPTCALAMAESERYLPSLITKLEDVMRDAGLEDDPIIVRMTGCPNGCARPYLGEIGFVGKAPGKYNLYLGASFNGDRLNKLYRENIGEEEVLAELTPLIERYAEERDSGERFGDFVVRKGVIKATSEGRDFHENVGPAA